MHRASQDPNLLEHLCDWCAEQTRRGWAEAADPRVNFSCRLDGSCWWIDSEECAEGRANRMCR